MGAAIFTYTRHVRLNLSQEAIVGIVYAVASALMVLVLSHAPHGAEHIKNILVGYLLFTTWDQVLKITIIYAVLGLIQWIFARRFIRLSWNPETITSEPFAKWWDFFFYILLGVAITLSVQVAGVLLVFSFLIVPAVITRLFSENLGIRLSMGWAIAAVASIMGLAASWHWDLPTGATIITALGMLLVIAITVRSFWHSPDRSK